MLKGQYRHAQVTAHSLLLSEASQENLHLSASPWASSLLLPPALQGLSNLIVDSRGIEGQVTLSAEVLATYADLLLISVPYNRLKVHLAALDTDAVYYQFSPSSQSASDQDGRAQHSPAANSRRGVEDSGLELRLLYPQQQDKDTYGVLLIAGVEQRHALTLVFDPAPTDAAVTAGELARSIALGDLMTGATTGSLYALSGALKGEALLLEDQAIEAELAALETSENEPLPATQADAAGGVVAADGTVSAPETVDVSAQVGDDYNLPITGTVGAGVDSDSGSTVVVVGDSGSTVVTDPGADSDSESTVVIGSGSNAVASTGLQSGDGRIQALTRPRARLRQRRLPRALRRHPYPLQHPQHQRIIPLRRCGPRKSV